MVGVRRPFLTFFHYPVPQEMHFVMYPKSSKRAYQRSLRGGSADGAMQSYVVTSRGLDFTTKSSLLG